MYAKKYLFPVILFIVFIITLWIISYQFGIQNFQGIKKEVVFSTLVTIFIFGTGYFIKSVEIIRNENKKDKQLERVFITNLETISDGLKSQIENFEEAIKTLKSPTPEKVIISSFAELDYFEINKIPSENLFRVFIDKISGNETENIKKIENLRKQLNFIEHSRNIFYKSFEKLYEAIGNITHQIIDAMQELGEYTDQSITSILNNNKNPENDLWFINFSEIVSEAQSVFKTSDETANNFEKLENEIIPKLLNFSKDNMEDLRTPVVSSIFGKMMSATFQRKDTIRNLINYVTFHLIKYKDSKRIIDESIKYYND